MSKVLLFLEVGEHGALEQEEVFLGSLECEASRSHQFAVPRQLEGRTLRLEGERGRGRGRVVYIK